MLVGDAFNKHELAKFLRQRSELTSHLQVIPTYLPVALITYYQNYDDKNWCIISGTVRAHDKATPHWSLYFERCSCNTTCGDNLRFLSRPFKSNVTFSEGRQHQWSTGSRHLIFGHKVQTLHPFCVIWDYWCARSTSRYTHTFPPTRARNESILVHRPSWEWRRLGRSSEQRKKKENTEVAKNTHLS